MEDEKIKPIELSWHTPTLGGECLHCGEWADYQEQNNHDDGWYFPPCESKDEQETGFEQHHAVCFKCPNCEKEVQVKTISW